MKFDDKSEQTAKQMQTNGACERRKKNACFDLHTTFLAAFFLYIFMYTTHIRMIRFIHFLGNVFSKYTYE